MRALTLALLVLATPAMAGEVTLTGTPTQGALLVGTASGAVAITLDKRTVPVSPEGVFAFGLGVDAAPTAHLTVKFADGTEDARDLTVTKRTWQEERVDGLAPETVNPPKAVLDRIAKENALIGKAFARTTVGTSFASGFIWPVTGRLSGVFGSRRVLNGQPMSPHTGVDIAAPGGTPILAAAAGVVALNEPNLYYTGGTVILDHGQGVTTTYAHLSSSTVKVGQRVAQGEVIGKVGATGRATGANLHWQINWFDVRLDPELVVPPMTRPQG